MKQNLQFALVSELATIKDEYALVTDETERKELILKVCQKACVEFGDVIMANCIAIINHYLSEGGIEIDALIGFLEVNKTLDHYTLQREKRDQFDQQYGTVTSPILSQYELPETISLQRFHTSHRYHPSPVSSVRMAIQVLGKYNIVYRDFVFIDVGSGMGRNLLLASEYPFRKIIGIEHSAYLHAIARTNIKIYRSATQKCHVFDLQCIDALTFQFPPENLVIYFWRPFSNEVAVKFIEQLEAFSASSTYRVILIFLGQVYPVVETSQVFHLLDVYFAPDLSFGDKEYFTLTLYSN